MTAAAKNRVCVWYDHEAEDAANFYVKTFPDSSVDTIERAPADYPGGKAGGVVHKGEELHRITDVRLDTDYEPGSKFHSALRAEVTLENGDKHRIEGTVKGFIPLRNRRTDANGNELVTRITEGMTVYRCNGMTGYGLSEYLDQIVDGKPTGTDYKAA